MYKLAFFVPPSHVDTVKQAVFAELDAVTPGHAILASNTSSLSITAIAAVTSVSAMAGMMLWLVR